MPIDFASSQLPVPKSNSPLAMFRDMPEWRALALLTGPAPDMPGDAFDWDRVVRLAERHKAVLQLARGLARLDADLPPPVATRLAEAARARSLRAMALAGEMIRVVTALQAENISVSVIKGQPLAQSIFGEVTGRDPGDLDLMLKPRDLEKASRILDGMGYEAEFGELLHSDRARTRLLRGTNQLAFWHAERQSAIELHWRWQKITGMMPETPGRIWNAAGVEIGGQRIPVPDPVEHFIYLCAHGGAHGWQRLKWLNDIRWALADPRFLAGRWEEVSARARALRMTNAVASALLVARTFDGQNLPSPLAVLVAGAPRAARLSQGQLEWMAETVALTEDPPPPRTPQAVARMLLRHSRVATADRAGGLITQLRLLLLPGAPDVAAVDLPTGLGIGYLGVRAARMARRVRGGQGQ